MAGGYFSNDTIAAIATSMAGDAGVGIIRISGPEALSAAQAVSAGLESPRPRYLHRIEIFADPARRDVLDDGLGVVFPSGASFTGEDVVELQLHGGRFVLNAALGRLIESGKCRIALPGEFSFRAVRSGRLSLSGAQALRQVIASESLYEVSSARRAFSETRRQEIDSLASRIRTLQSQCELSIDFSDQDVEVLPLPQLIESLEALLNDENVLIEQARMARKIAAGVSVALVGAPNAGKSSLFNAILAEERAIVSAEPGTTRDVVAETIQIGPYKVRLQDTAGVRESRNAIESEGIARALELARQADMAVVVVDAERPISEISEELRALCAGRSGSCVLAMNKVDLVSREARVALERSCVEIASVQVVSVSAKSGSGVAGLIAAMKERLDQQLLEGVGAFLPTEFQLQMLQQSRTAVMEALDCVRAYGTARPEIVSATLARAVRAMSDLVGDTTPDTILAKIFSEFCIGK